MDVFVMSVYLPEFDRKIEISPSSAGLNFRLSYKSSSEFMLLLSTSLISLVTVPVCSLWSEITTILLTTRLEDACVNPTTDSISQYYIIIRV